MKADRNAFVSSFHLPLPYECKMDLQCSSGQTSFTNPGHRRKRLPRLGVSRQQILTWQQFLSSSLPFCSPGYQGTNWDTSVPSLNSMEMPSILCMQCCIMELVTCSLDLYFAWVSTFGALQVCFMV